MSYMKRRMALYLSLLIAITTVFFAVPAQQAEAATEVYFSWRFNYEAPSVKVQKGAQNLYIGDYVSASISGTGYGYYNYLSLVKGVKYSSDKSSVVAINATTGKMTAKKNGTAVITVSYKGKSTKCTVEVVSSTKEFKPEYAYYSGDKYAKELIKAYGAGLTAKNCYKVMSIDAKTSGFSNGYNNKYSESGKTEYGVYAPECAHAKALAYAVNDYILERSPFSTAHGKAFDLKTISGSKKNVSANMKKPVTAEQIIGLQGSVHWDTELSPKNTIEFPIYLRNMKTGHRYYAVATIKKGSSKMGIKTKNLNLKKGITYQLESCGYDNDWLQYSTKNSFKAK